MIEDLRQIDLWYDNADSQRTALALVLALCPEWEDSRDAIEFVRFTDGITNTVCVFSGFNGCYTLRWKKSMD
jgi:ethanolamine kinase